MEKAVKTIAGPRCIVYRTRTDCRFLVPVIMTHDKSAIASFPDVKDIYFKGELAIPEELTGGYLLDNRGIGPDVAFLKVTYGEYARMKETPAPAELMQMIADRDPLVDMYDCGTRSQYPDAAGAMKLLIGKGELHRQKRLK